MGKGTSMIPNKKAFDGKSCFEADGKTFYQTYKIPQQGRFQLKLRIVAINSHYRQAIAFGFSHSPDFISTLYINSKEFAPEKRKLLSYIIPVSLAENSNVVFDLDIAQGHFYLANASDFLDDYPGLAEKISAQTGRAREEFRGNSYASGFNTAGLYANSFWIETLSDNHLRFHCNDHKMDDDFDDLIFDMEIIPQPAGGYIRPYNGGDIY